MPTDIEVLPRLLVDPETKKPETNEGPKPGDREPEGGSPEEKG